MVTEQTAVTAGDKTLAEHVLMSGAVTFGECDGVVTRYFHDRPECGAVLEQDAHEQDVRAYDNTLGVMRAGESMVACVTQCILSAVDHGEGDCIDVVY